MKTIKSIKKRNVKRGKATSKVSNVSILSDNQLSSIDNISNIRDRAIINFLLHTGLRANELVNLNYSNVFTNIRTKEVSDTLVVENGKGNKERQIPLNNTAKESIILIDRYNRNVLQVKGINKNSPLLITRVLTRPTVVSIENIVEKYLKSNPHTLRHTCFTNMRKENVRLEVIQKIAGHSDIKTTVKYYLGVTSEDLKEAVKSIDNTTIEEKEVSNNDNVVRFKKVG